MGRLVMEQQHLGIVGPSHAVDRNSTKRNKTNKLSGEAHTIFLKNDGTVYGVGSNTYGKLGDGTTDQQINPVQVLDVNGGVFSGVHNISAGFNHNIFLKNNGTVWANGYNSWGLLGDRTSTNSSHPVQVLGADANVFTGAIDISAASHHSIYLKDDGTVWGVARNLSGQLGNGSTASTSNMVQAIAPDSLSEPFGKTYLKQISARSSHTVYLKSDGTVGAVGYNIHGQLGDGTTMQRTNPVQVTNADGTELSGVVGISVGSYHSVFLKSDGTVWATGKNEYGQLGDGTTTQRTNPVQVTNADGTELSGVVGISAGSNHTVYLKAMARCGDGTELFWQVETVHPPKNQSFPGNEWGWNGLNGVVGISARRNHTVYLKSDGTVWAAGYNYNGQLGDGTTTQRNNPVQVTNGDGTGLNGVVGISAGSSHTVYLKSDGTVWAAGSNTSGRLGDGTTTQRTNPVQVTNVDGSGLNGVVGISAGGNHTVYLKSDGTVWAVGSNSYGQLGYGSTTQRTNPVQVTNGDGSGLSGVVGISAGGSHTVYLKGDGTVWAAGYNGFGQLGDGTITQRNNRAGNECGWNRFEWSGRHIRGFGSHSIFKKRWHGVGDGKEYLWRIRRRHEHATNQSCAGNECGWEWIEWSGRHIRR